MPQSPDCLTVVHTGYGRRNGADDRIVELVYECSDRAAFLVYTSDAKLRTRVMALGTQVMGSRTLLSQIAALRATMAPTYNGHSRDSVDGLGSHYHDCQRADSLNAKVLSGRSPFQRHHPSKKEEAHHTPGSCINHSR